MRYELRVACWMLKVMALGVVLATSVLGLLYTGSSQGVPHRPLIVGVFAYAVLGIVVIVWATGEPKEDDQQ